MVVRIATDEPIVTPARPWPLRRLRLLLVAALALALVAAAGLAIRDVAERALDARRELLAAREDMLAARDVFSPLIAFELERWPATADYERARARIWQATDRIDRARTRLGYLEEIAPRLGWLPVYGEQIESLPRVLGLAKGIALVSYDLVDAVEPLFADEGRVVDAARLVFSGRGERIARDLDALAALSDRGGELSAIGWSGPLDQVERSIAQLVADADRIPEARDLVTAMRDGFDPLLGFGRPAEYLLLGQNDHELRATGGFIGSAGVLRLEDGRFAGADYGNAYDFNDRDGDVLRPPDPLVRYMGLSEWHFRDANWWPHFPASAERALAFLAEQGAAPAHVVAVDSAFIGELLRLYGPVGAEGYDEPLDAGSWFVATELRRVEEGKEEALGPLLEELLRRVEQTGRERLPDLVDVLRRGAAGRHLQIYSTEPAVQRLVERMGADGALRAGPGEEVVGVVDSSITYSKLPPEIVQREITLLARADGARDLIVTWRNGYSAYAGERYPRMESGHFFRIESGAREPAIGVFGSLTRVYLPEGSRLISFDGFDRLDGLYVQEGFSILAGTVEVGDGESQTLRVSYVPPEPQPAIRVWKQAGTSAGRLTLLENTPQRQQVTHHRGPFTEDVGAELVGE